VKSATAAPPWAEVRALFEALAEAPREEREPLLRRDSVDPALAAEVRALLAAHDAEPSADTGFLARPARLPQAPPDRRGQRLGPWRLTLPLGSGGMGEVWEAQRDDGAYEARVAIKLLQTGFDASELLQRFRQEQRLLARLNHPNIARLLDAGQADDGQPYFVMEAVDGRPLDEACRGLPLEARLRLVLQLADAISHAHRQGLIHRDLKPANVLVDAHGQVKLLDFGIAHAMDRDPEAAEAPRPLTPGYASPEQVRGEPVTAASDVYSLGVLLHVVLTGVRPYGRGSSTAAAALQAVLDDAPTRPSQAPSDPRADAGVPRQQLAGDLDAIALKAMAKSVGQRYGSVEALAGDLRAMLASRPVSARPRTPAYVARRFVARHRSTAAAAVLALVAVVAALGTAAWQTRDALAALALVVLAVALGFSTWQARQAARARDEAQSRLAQTNGLVRDVLMRYADMATFLPGGLQIKADLLTDTIVHLERLQHSAPRDLRLIGERAKAHARLADMQLPIQDATLDRQEQSELNTERALPLFPLAEPAHRDDPEFFVWWARALHCRASLDQLAGDPAGALRRQQRRLGLLETVLRSHPGHYALRFERANTLLAIGQIHKDTLHRPSLEQPEAALQAFGSAQLAYAALAQEKPDGGDAAFELGSVADMQLQVLHGLGRLAEAREAGERAVAWRDKALATRPTHSAYRMGSVGVRNNLVSFMLNTGQTDGIEALASSGEALVHALERDDPGQGLWTSRRRLFALNWGRALLAAGRAEEAVPRLNEAMADMMEATSGHMLVRRAIGSLALARAKALLGDSVAARRHAEQANADLRMRLAEDPGDSRAQQCLREVEELVASA
jgi:tetratricopeptide (TPR) repeat protein